MANIIGPVYDEEEELKRRMALARQQGWSEDEVQRSALIERNIQKAQSYQAQQQALSQRVPEQEKKKPWWSAWLGEAGGTGGALAGGAIGTAILPGIGTLIGAGLGGLAGGFGGSLGEQKIREDKVDLKRALGAGILEGTLAAGPLKFAKAAKVGGQALLKGAGKKALQEASESIIKKSTGAGILTRAGKTLRGEARGIDVGAKLGGKRIGTEKVTQLNQFLENVIKPKGGSAAAQQEAVEQFIQAHSNTLSKAITKSNRALSSVDKNSLIKSLQSDFKNRIIGASKRQNDIASDLIQRIKQAPDVKSLDDLRKIVDEGINFARNVNSPEPAAEQVFKLFRQGLTTDVAAKVGAAKYIKTNLHKAFDIDELILNKAAKPGSGFSPAGITLPGRAAQAAETGAGKVLGGLGKVSDVFRGYGPAATGLRVTAGSALAGGFRQPQPQELPADISQVFAQPQSPEEEMINQLVAGGITDPQQQFDALSGQGQFVAPEAAMSDQAGTGFEFSSVDYANAAGQAIQQGDLKTAKQYMDFAKVMAEFEQNAGGGGGMELTADQQKKLTGISNAETQLDRLDQSLESSGLFPQGNQLSASLGGLYEKSIGRFTDTQKKIYQDQLRSKGIQIIRAMGEVGNLTEAEQNAAIATLPGPGDTLEGAREKLRRLREDFSRVKENIISFGGTYGAPADDFSDFSQLFNQGAF